MLVLWKKTSNGADSTRPPKLSLEHSKNKIIVCGTDFCDFYLCVKKCVETAILFLLCC